MQMRKTACVLSLCDQCSACSRATRSLPSQSYYYNPSKKQNLLDHKSKHKLQIDQKKHIFKSLYKNFADSVVKSSSGFVDNFAKLRKVLRASSNSYKIIFVFLTNKKLSCFFFSWAVLLWNAFRGGISIFLGFPVFDLSSCVTNYPLQIPRVAKRVFCELCELFRL